MRGIPNRREYENNLTRCVAISSLSKPQLASLKERNIEISPDLEISHHMMSRLAIVTHIGTHIDAPRHFVDGTSSIDEPWR